MSVVARLVGKLLACSAAMILSCLLPPQAGAEPAASPGPRLRQVLADERIPSGLGVNVHAADGRIYDYAQIYASGFRLIRTDVLWSAVEASPGVYDWSRYDALLDTLKQAGLTPLLILSYSNPLYARRLPGRPDTPSLGYEPPIHGEARAGYMAFARAAVARYRGRAIWEVWNEPDLNFGHPVDLPAFVNFAIEACAAIRGVDPDAAVIGPAASGFAWRLLRQFASSDRDGCYDAVSIHPYRDRPPEDVLSDWSRLRELVRTHSAASVTPSFVSSEWGYSSAQGFWSQSAQADMVLRLYLLNLLAGVRLTVVYDWWDDGPSPTDKEANFGLLDFGGSPKAAHDGLRDLIRSLNGMRLLGRVPTGTEADFVLAFAGDDGRVQRLVGWTTRAGPSPVTLGERGCVQPPGTGREGCAETVIHRLGRFLRVRLGSRPAIIEAGAADPGG